MNDLSTVTITFAVRVMNTFRLYSIVALAPAVDTFSQQVAPGVPPSVNWPNCDER